MSLMVNEKGVIDYKRMDEFDLSAIKNNWKETSTNMQIIEANRVLLKIKRDVLGVCNTMQSDMNLMVDENYQLIKQQVKVLSYFMLDQIEYLEMASTYENSNQIKEVIEKLLTSEYAQTKYSVESDFPFWEKFEFPDSAYPPNRLLHILYLIHNSKLSQKTAKFYTDTLIYQSIRENNWGRNPEKQIRHMRTKRDVGEARDTVRKDRNKCLAELYSWFDFVNYLTNILIETSYDIKTYDERLLSSFQHARTVRKDINKKSLAFQKELRHSPNASCWLDNGIKHIK